MRSDRTKSDVANETQAIPLLCTLRERAGVRAVEESPDGRWLATVGVEHAVRLWHPRTGRKRWLLERPPEPGWALAFTPDGKLIAAGGHHSRVYLWRVPRRSAGWEAWVAAAQRRPRGLSQ